MTIICTGCSGMIGSNLCHWLIENTDHIIVGIDNLSGGWISNCPNDKTRFKFYNLDVCDEKLNDIFQFIKPDIVYHAAAYAAENLSPFIRKFNYTNNLVGTANIVNCCIENDVKRLVFFSSIAVYGHGEPPYKETDVPLPNDPYGIAKYACELDIKVAGEQHGLDWCIVRPYNVYGRRQNIKDKYRNVLGIFINQFLTGKPLTIFGDGKQIRNFTNVDDLMHPLYLAGTSGMASKEVINIGSDIPYMVIEAAKMLIGIMGGGTIRYLEQRHEVKVVSSDNSKAYRLLDYQHITELYEGIKDMYEWVKNNPQQGETISPEYEITKGIYKAWQK